MKKGGGVRVLLVAGVFAKYGGDPWLIDDLAAELARRGALVEVLVYDVSNTRPAGVQQSNTENVRVFSVGPQRQTHSRALRMLSYLTTMIRLRRHGLGLVGKRRYDICIYFSPAILSAGLPGHLRRHNRVRRLVFVLWDFFPVHHMEIGSIRYRSLERPLRWLERRAIEHADAIAVMSDRNAQYLSAYHPSYSGQVLIVPPWGGVDGPMSSQLPKFREFTVVFGGQLTAGRGVETLLDAAEILIKQRLPARIMIIGSGPNRARLQLSASGRKLVNVVFADRVSRSEYLSTIGQAHVGLAITVADVSVPSFPSKIVDYFRVGIPAIVSVERASDVGSLIEDAGAGLAVDAGNAKALAGTIELLWREWLVGTLAWRGVNARAFYRDNLSTSAATDILLS